MDSINKEELSETVDSMKQNRSADSAVLLGDGKTPFEKEYVERNVNKKDDTVALYLLGSNKELRHREELMGRVLGLATASFGLLVAVIIFQMIIRLFFHDYQGVSDTVVSIVALSVFGQVLVLMTALSVHLWKNNVRMKMGARAFGPIGSSQVIDQYEEEFSMAPQKRL